jgi:hypothetical protein
VERGKPSVKRKKPMPGYYGKNVVQNAERKFLRRKASEADQEKRRDSPEGTVTGGQDRKN